MKRPFRSADRRLVGAAVVSGLLFVPLGVFGSSALARTATGQGPSAAQYQYKVLVCHHTGSKKHPWHTISISNRALPAHLRHHDTVGPCTSSPTTGHDHGKPTSGPSQTSSESHGKSNEHVNASSTSHGNQGKGDDNGHHGKS